MTWQLLQFEWRWQMRRATYVAIALIVCAFSLVLVRQGYGPEAAYINSPYSVIQSSGLLTLWFVMVLTMLCVHGALRDDEHRMRELVHSRPIGLVRLHSTRLLGLWSSALFVAAIVLLLQLVAPYLVAKDPSRVGPLRILPYVWTLVWMYAPNLLLITAVLYAAATYTRSTLATYIGGILLFSLYMVTALLIDSPLMAGAAPATPESMARAAVLDPFGLSAFFEATRYWTPAERNFRLLPVQGHFLQNRVLWFCVSIALLLTSYRRAPERAARGAFITRWRRTHTRPLDPVPRSAYVPVVASTSNFSTQSHAFLTTLRIETRLLLGAWTVQALLVLWMFVVGIEIMSALRGGEYGTHVLATSALLTSRLREPLALLGNVSVAYFAAELVWRERTLRFDALLDATPTPNAAFYVGKLFALWSIPLLLVLSGLLVALGVQLWTGDQPVIPSVFWGQSVLLSIPLLWRAVVLIGIHLIAVNRWVGLIGGVAFLVQSVSGQMPWLEHPMLRFAWTPLVSYSDLDGFGPALPSYIAMALYWGCWSALIAVVSQGLWRRGLDRGLVARCKSIGAALGREGRLAAVAATLLCVGASSALWLHDDGPTGWRSSTEQSQWRVDYERRYRNTARAPQPSIRAVELNVDLFPERRIAQVHGIATLENRTERTIDSVWMVTRRDADSVRLTLQGARTLTYDSRFGVWTAVLAAPLAPGELRRMEYHYMLDRGGVRLGESDLDVARDGSYLQASVLLPSIGYRGSFEESDPRIRASAALGTATTRLADTAAIDSLTRLARRVGQSPPWLTIHATVSTAADQDVVGPGTLTRSWTTNGRRYFTYDVPEPTTPTFAFASARYDVRRATQNGVDIEVWHHPGHDQNVERMLLAAQRTIALMGASMGPYPRSVLRMAEIPAGWGFGAFATAGVLFFTEDRGMLADATRILDSRDVDLVTRRVAHEVAHQWWGHSVEPLNVTGATVLVESLAKYAEQRVIASLQGEDAVASILSYDHDRYLRGRAEDADAEPALISTVDEAYLYYGKGALAFHALRSTLGDSTLTRVLAALVASERGAHGAATATQLHRMLRDAAVTSEARALVDEWMTGRVIHDIRLDSAWAVRGTAGYAVEANIRVDRVSMSASGEQIVPADGALLEYAVMGGADANLVLRRGAARTSGGQLHLALTLPERPVSLVLDPLLRRIDRDRSNNARQIVIQR